MGRSTASCFKIITCGSDSVDRDDLGAPESKGSSDKRGWSFRKRSARHRVLSNTVISETRSSGNNESPESTTINLQTPSNSIPQKATVIQSTDEKTQFPAKATLCEAMMATEYDGEADEKTQLPAKPMLCEATTATDDDGEADAKTQLPAKPTLCEAMTATEDDCEADVIPDESVVIIIQTAVRAFLAQRALLMHKKVTKLQAAVRGHLVRNHAVGTLRCVQAIVKMQTLVRARRARSYIDGSAIVDKLDEEHGKGNLISKFSFQAKENNLDSQPRNISIEKLLNNRFARQLLETTPRGKPINIKCEPSKADSSWKWLERWMSASEIENEGSGKLVLVKENIEHSEGHMETVIPTQKNCGSMDLNSSTEASAEQSESDENLITYDADSLNFQAGRPNSLSLSPNPEKTLPQNCGDENPGDASLNALPLQDKQSDLVSELEPNSLQPKCELESEQHASYVENFAPEQSEGKKSLFGFGSRKASNPAFIAAQSKFEELSSASYATKIINSSTQDIQTESFKDPVSSGSDHGSEKNDIARAEDSVPQTSGIQIGGSECGTELSISSTLDSPERSEVGALEFEQETKISEDATSCPKSIGNVDAEAEGHSTVQEADLSYSSVQPGGYDSVNDDIEQCHNSVTAVDSSHVEQKSESNVTCVQMELETNGRCQVHKSSPEASPRSHVTVPESQGTPSSQVSVKPKKIKSETSGSDHKHRSFSAGKRSTSNPNHDSGTSSLEQLTKDHTTGKRRNSFGSARTENVDQEPRDSSSSNSLPSYMQATESARAKAVANSSPRASPDIQNKDIYIKKRHSLPGSNGRHGSPRIQRSMSQAQQSTKGNGTHSPHERKWQR